MNVVLVTGSSGLVGGQCVEFFSKKFDLVIGVDNDMRAIFFGKNASTQWNLNRLKDSIVNFKNYSIDIRVRQEIENIFQKYNSSIKLIIHCAAQPSHDWAVTDPHTDFTVNANGTLTILEATRKFSDSAVFIHLSTNKVYGDTPNYLPFKELDSRWELENTHEYFKYGINELMSIDNSKHSLFGCSKLSADVLAQEYGKYLGIKTGIFRGGCLTGPMHSGTELHGFLSYLVKCCLTGTTYQIFGHKGKQVRDNIHSLDLVKAFEYFYNDPEYGEVYNIGGSREANCSLLEAVEIIESYTNKKINTTYVDTARKGDHIWYISSVEKFKNKYPNWGLDFTMQNTIHEICDEMDKRI